MVPFDREAAFATQVRLTSQPRLAEFLEQCSHLL
jgi:hypothetical protein